MKLISALLPMLTLGACSMIKPPSRIPTPVPGVGISLDDLTGVANTASTTSAYDWIIPLCIGAGIVMLTVTRGKRGWWPLMGAGGIIIFNIAMVNYANWIIIPCILTGIVILGFFVWNRIGRRKKCLNSNQSLETLDGSSPRSWLGLLSVKRSSVNSKESVDSESLAERKDN